MTKLTAETKWLRAGVTTDSAGVDREKNIIRGMVLAQAGPFKTQGRGEFDEVGLRQIATLGKQNEAGLKSRFAHPNLSSDGIGKFLGRVKNIGLGTARVQRNGVPTHVMAVRGDLHLDKTALEEPPGGGKPLGLYVMDLAESDPDAISSSLVLTADQKFRVDPKTKRPLADTKGEALPPLWFPTALHASDIVGEGEAVDGLLSAQLGNLNLPDNAVRQATQLLDKAFPGASREVVKERVQAMLGKYLDSRFGSASDDAGDGLSDEERAFVAKVPVSVELKIKAAIRAEIERGVRQSEHEDYLNRKWERRDAAESWERLVALNRERGEWIALRGRFDLLHRLRTAVNAGQTANTGATLRALEGEIGDLLRSRV